MRTEIQLSSIEIMEAVNVVKGILESGNKVEIDINRKTDELMIFSKDRGKTKYRTAITVR